jgi:hypothetical protein
MSLNGNTYFLFSKFIRISKYLSYLLVLFLTHNIKAQEPTAKIVPRADAFELPANIWTKIAEVPADPLGREIEPGRGAYLCYVPIKNIFIRYGGYTPTESNALWSFDLAKRQWTNQLADDYSFPPPLDRPGAGPWWSMAWDSKHKMIWFHGGSGVGAQTHEGLFNALWSYDPSTATFKKIESKNYPKYGAPIVYDSKNDLLVRAPAYSGEWSAMHNRDATWVFDFAKNEWERRTTKSSPVNVLAGVWVYDPSSGKCVYLLNEKDGSAQTWVYDAATNVWEKLETELTPPGRVCVSSAYDPLNKVILVYGGVGKAADYGYLYRGGGVQLHDTWALDVTKKQWKKLEVGAPVIPILNGQGKQNRFETCQAAGYDEKLGVFLISSPTIGVWALRYQVEGSVEYPVAKLAPLEPLVKPKIPESPVYKLAEPNAKLVNIEPGKWLTLAGGHMGGGEVPVTYDESTGFILKYGGCNDRGTTFASGYGNDLWGYDPATERWLALRYTDPCGPNRPFNACTRYYAFDSDFKVTWFAGGTAGNNLCNTLPDGWSGFGIWKYDGVKDRFDMVSTKNSAKVGAGVVTGCDRANKIFLTGPKAYSHQVFGFTSTQMSWSEVSNATYTDQYAYATYVDSQKCLFLVSKSKNDWGTFALDASKGSWRKLETTGDLPEYMAMGRPVCSYDPNNDVVLLVGGADEKAKREQEGWAYRIKDNRWEKLKEPAPSIDERMIYDRRHKVFIGFSKKGPVAYRLAN